MRRWTLEEKACQAELIKTWQPWKKAGVKTPEGKAISKMNAYKHGLRSADIRNSKNIITLCKKKLKEITVVLNE